jgi:membrane-associated HD superfamily phosphohydrolase
MLYRDGYYPIKPIPLEIKVLYNAVLIKKGVPLPALFQYRNWLRYYLIFCLKYHREPANKRSFAPFVQKLKEKNQTEQQRKQAFDVVSIFYRIEKKKTDQNTVPVLNNKNENISTKKKPLANPSRQVAGYHLLREAYIIRHSDADLKKIFTTVAQRTQRSCIFAGPEANRKNNYKAGHPTSAGETTIRQKFSTLRAVSLARFPN